MVRREVFGGAHRKIDQPGLGRTIGWVGLRANLPGNRREEQHRAALLLDKRERKSMSRVDRAKQVHTPHAVPVGRLQIPKRKAELARAYADRIDDMLDVIE